VLVRSHLPDRTQALVKQSLTRLTILGAVLSYDQQPARSFETRRPSRSIFWTEEFTLRLMQEQLPWRAGSRTHYN
jgi:hypothetical protein